MASEERVSVRAFDALRTDAPAAARRLLGSHLIADIDDHPVRLKIVETEAYDQTDAASHSYKGKTPRTEIMFGPAGYLYVYFTYGMHYCCNVVVGNEGYGAAVLIRAVEPLDFSPTLSRRRGGRTGVERTNGPAKLCQALCITTAMNGHDLRYSPLRLRLLPALEDDQIAVGPRIGIRSAVDVPWRFHIIDNPYVSGRNVVPERV